MIVNVSDEQTSLPLDPLQIEQIVHQVLKEEGVITDEVNIYFVDTPTISNLHQLYFNDPTTTDCISFPMDLDDEETDYSILGEVFVCPETAIDYAKENQHNPYEETTLYIVHGLLHLLGYDDIEDPDREEMRLAEKRHMHKLKNLDLILKNKER
jgi:probable rRNA maturation factor